MYIGFYSDVLKPNQITDYLIRAVQPRLQAVDGVQTAEILGAKNFALRAWLDPQKLAAHGLTAADVYSALAANNFLTSTGNAKGQMVQINLSANTNLTSLDGFKNMVVKTVNGQVGAARRRGQRHPGRRTTTTPAVAFDGKTSVFIGIQVAPGANLLDVIARVRKALPDIQAQLPAGLQGGIIYDSTKFVNASIDEVIKTLVEAVLIVTAVVFIFLGSLRSVVIPLVAIPLSIVGDLHRDAGAGLSPSTCSRCWRSCWPSGWWWTMPSSSWKTSAATSRTACREWMQPCAQRASWPTPSSR